MINVEITGRLVDLSKLDLKDPFERVAKKLQLSIQKNFEHGGRPAQWEQIHKTGLQSHLWESGKMYSMIESGSDKMESWAGIREGRERELPYLYAHQYGRAEINLSPRPYIMFQDEDIEMVNTELVGYIQQYFDSKGKEIKQS